MYDVIMWLYHTNVTPGVTLVWVVTIVSTKPYSAPTMRLNEFVCNKHLQRKLPDPFPFL